jgi:hypothetical protein
MKRPHPLRSRPFRSGSIKVVAASAALTFLAVPLASPVFAEGETTQTPTTRVPRTVDLDAVRTRCLSAIDRRFATLDELDAKVSAAAKLSDGQEAELHASIDATRTGLSGLRGEIEGDTDATELRNDCRRIVDDYRVYVLLAPQVRLITAADSAQTIVATLESVIPRHKAAIDEAAANGQDVTEANRLLDSIEASTAEADTLSQGVLDAVGPLTPADFNDGTAAPILRQARADLATVAKDLASARANIGLLVDLLD